MKTMCRQQSLLGQTNRVRLCAIVSAATCGLQVMRASLFLNCRCQRENRLAMEALLSMRGEE